MTEGIARGQQDADEVYAAWAPAGTGRIVVLLTRGVVIHKAIVSGKAGAVGIAQGVAGGTGLTFGTTAGTDGSPFIKKVLRNGVAGLLASPRKTLVLWDDIVSAEYRKLFLGRGRLTIRTKEGEHTLKFLQNTHVAGDPQAVFAHFLGGRFTDTSR